MADDKKKHAKLPSMQGFKKLSFEFFIGPGYFLVAGFAGTPGYLSPEVLRKDPYGKPVDVWACGKDGNYNSYLIVI